MDHWFLSFLFFVIALILYFHIQNQYKTSEDLEIYETDYVSNEKLQETCSLKQPVLFSLVVSGLTTDHLSQVATQLYIKDIREYYQPDTSSVEPIALKTSSAIGLLSTDTRSTYFSEHNELTFDLGNQEDMINDLHSLLQPKYTVQTHVDVLIGSRKAYTPMTYHPYSQRFLLVHGKDINCGIRVKMCPWKNTARLHVRKDYEHNEFWSTMNMYRGDEDKFRILDFVVNPGYVLFIPSYWWYSIQFLDTSTCVTAITYTTAINWLANIKSTALYFYHQPNLKQKIVDEIIPSLLDTEEEKEKDKTKELKETLGRMEDKPSEKEEDSTDSPDNDSHTPEQNQDISLQLISELNPKKSSNNI